MHNRTHSGPWDRHEFRQFADRHNVVLVRAAEVETDMGHMLAFGIDQYQAGFHKAETLCRTMRSIGGFVVSAHPFRAVLGRSMATRPLLYPSRDEEVPQNAEAASSHPVFKLAHAVEVANGGTADNENDMAMEVATLLKMPVTGGSDAHSVHGIGKFVTAFRDEINNEQEFLAALHAGAFYPATGLRSGRLRPYFPGDKND